ncbi:zinc-ribbon domain-containing protein, partial [Escherichia albertii]
MYAKSFLAFDGNGRLTGARTAQTAPYDRYTCHLCGSALRYHPQYDTERPWFEHTGEGLAEHGHECPYVRPERREILLIKRLQQWVPDALPVVRKTSWHCRQCHHDYYGEQYCTH